MLSVPESIIADKKPPLTILHKMRDEMPRFAERIADRRLNVLSGHHVSILAWGRDGEAWESDRLSWEGITNLRIEGKILHGEGWDLMTDKTLPFALDLDTGKTNLNKMNNFDEAIITRIATPNPQFPHPTSEENQTMPSVTGRAFQVTAAGGDFALVEREFPEPGPGHVRIRVQACGVCHSDSVTKFGLFPGIAYPRVPGHEVAGVIDAIFVAADVPIFKVGQRVGLGWHGGHCNYCVPCRRGDFILCENQKISGISYDGGYADYVLAPANALALIPDDLSDVDAAPLMCAGVTTYNALRHSGAKAGDLVAVLGIGGLGHLGVQYAAKAGYHTVAVARGADKGPLAKELGAHRYIDSKRHQDFAAELQKLERRNGDSLDPLLTLRLSHTGCRWACSDRTASC